METLIRDIRYGFRSLLKRPGFTAIALVALALGIGANTAIFSLVNAVVLQPLPYAEPDRLVWVWGNIRNGGNRASVSPLDFLDFRSQNKTFEQFAATVSIPLPANLTGSGGPERLTASAVTGNYFQTLGVTPAFGRGFSVDNERPGNDQVTILSHDLWQKRFGGNPGIINQRIVLDGKSFEVIGVMPKGISFPQTAELWVPINFDAGPEMKQRKAHFMRPLGRAWANVIPGLSLNLVVRTKGDPTSIVGAVRKEVQAIDPDQPIAAIKTMDAWVDSSVAAPRYRTTLLALFAGLAMVLAATGIYGVMSYSVAQRTHEIGVRMALGARRLDVLGLVVRQGMVLVLVGLGIGLAIAFALTRLMSSLLFGVTAKDPITFVGVALLLSVVALIACYIPARRATKVDPLEALRYE